MSRTKTFVSVLSTGWQSGSLGHDFYDNDTSRVEEERDAWLEANPDVRVTDEKITTSSNMATDGKGERWLVTVTLTYEGELTELGMFGMPVGGGSEQASNGS